MIERLVNVGDVVTAGQVVAKLDPQIQQNSLRSAEGNLSSLEALLTDARLTFWRQQELVKDGWTPRAKFDEAQQKLQSAQAQVDSAQAQVRTAQEQLSYTVLSADAPGAVTAIGAEPGEVVHAGQMIVSVARQGGRDAVFDVPEQLIGRVRATRWCRSPSPTTRPCGPPAACGRWRPRQMPPRERSRSRSASSIRPRPCDWGPLSPASVKLSAPPGVEIPASALTEANGRPAVWVVDPESQTVSLRTWMSRDTIRPAS